MIAGFQSTISQKKDTAACIFTRNETRAPTCGGNTCETPVNMCFPTGKYLFKVNNE